MEEFIVMRFWKIFLLHTDRDWGRYVKEKSIFVGQFGPEGFQNLDKYSCKEDMAEFIPEGAATQLWQFSNDIKKGDLVVAYGPRRVLGVGRVIGSYRFDPILDPVDQCYHKSHIRGVRWVELKPHVDASTDKVLFCDPPIGLETLNAQIKILEISREEWGNVLKQYPTLKKAYQKLAKPVKSSKPAKPSKK